MRMLEGYIKLSIAQVVSKSVEEKYNTISSLLFHFHSLPLCVLRVTFFHCEWCESL
jgi:hypothetical protein